MPLPPTAPLDAVGPDETLLFCVGGHMAGLPLNRQLTERGGRFVREARTAPLYRLYDLGDRPGLVAQAGGAAIAGEIWALPTASLGSLLALIPSPLGLGTVMLDGGPCLGWRAHLAARDDVAALVDAGTKLLGLKLDPAWRDGVAANLRTILAQARTLGDPPLPDEFDPAPVFRA
jgi:allophanate hydrolase